MLNVETPFPYVGSHALFNDPDMPKPQPTELVRILWRREGFAMISFPLRDGASGNKVVPADELIDASPLSGEETREFHDLDRDLIARGIVAVAGTSGRPKRLTPRQKALKARRDALKQRMIFAPLMERLLRAARARTSQAAA